jgi:hypothetical protein
MTEDISKRLLQLEMQTGQCMTTVAECSLSMQRCASDVNSIQKDIKHQNQMTETCLKSIQSLLEEHHLLLNGNPRQDTKDRGLIGDVEQLKSSDARKKKLYWSMISAFVVVIVSSLWTFVTGVTGKESNERSEPTETTVQKTSPDTHFLHGDRRSTRRD